MPQSSVNERLIEVRNEVVKIKKISVDEFYKNSKIAQGAFQSIASGDVKLSGIRIERMCDAYPEINWNYVFKGQGNKLLSKDEVDPQKKAMDVLIEQLDYMRRQNEELKSELKKLKKD